MRMLKYMVGISFVYIIFSIIGVIYFGIPLELIQFCWLIVIAAPWYNKPDAQVYRRCLMCIPAFGRQKKGRE